MMLQKFLLKKILKKWQFGDYEVIFWDGERLKIGNGSKFSIHFKRPLKYSKDLALSIAEGYMDGDIEISGSMDEIMRVLYLFGNAKHLNKHENALSKIKPMQEKENIKSHYDLGNDFYKLWLDETMSYSCAYFKNEDDSLYQAQINKIEHTLKKLDLQPNERLLDIGCGWGWLAIMAAQKYGVKVVGITLSEEQYKKGNQRIKEYNLEDQVEIRLQSYQNLSGETFDKIVSVGMFEHVGKNNLPLYFMKIKSLLKPGGSLLLHSIISMFEGETNAWIDKYIFPGGYLPSLRETVSIMSECDFHLLMAESLRIHYAKTLDMWYENFMAIKDKASQMYDERFVRMWALYLSSCASGFRIGSIDIFQFLLTKGVNNSLKLTKSYIYS